MWSRGLLYHVNRTNKERYEDHQDVAFTPNVVGMCRPVGSCENMDEVPLQLKRDVLSMPIYNESQLFQKKYSVINIVEGISCKNKAWVWA